MKTPGKQNDQRGGFASGDLLGGDKVQQVFKRAGVTERQSDAYTRVVINGETKADTARAMGISATCVGIYVGKATHKLSQPWMKKIAQDILAA